MDRDPELDAVEYGGSGVGNFGVVNAAASADARRVPRSPFRRSA